jgi:subtilisin
VIDNTGLVTVKTTTITVNANTPVTAPQMTVQGVSVTVIPYKNGQAQAVASVKVTDKNGNVLGGASVTGTWSGVVSGPGSGTTNSSGLASINSSRTKSTGTFTFTVTNVALSGYTYSGTSVSGSASR